MKQCAMYHATNERKLENEKYYFIQNAIKREYAKLSMNKQHDLTMNECLTTPQHENRSAIGCQNKVDA